MNPVRIQRKRAKGWRMPSDVVYVGRPTKWGSPFRVGREAEDLADSLQLYRQFLEGLETLIRRELRGKSLACWCPLDRECHADILLEVANQ